MSRARQLILAILLLTSWPAWADQEGDSPPFFGVTPGTLTNPQTPTQGTSNASMRADAKVGIPPPATPSTQAFGDTATSGAGTGFSTDTHKHGMPAEQGAWKFVATLNLSGTSVTSATLPTDADIFMVVFDGARAGDNANFDMRFNSDSAANYNYREVGSTIASSTGTAQFRLVTGASAGQYITTGVLYFDRIAGLDNTHAVRVSLGNSGLATAPVMDKGWWANSAAVTTFTLIGGALAGQDHLYKLGKQ